jgi:hypothetical protein
VQERRFHWVVPYGQIFTERPDSDSDVNDDLSFKSLSSKVVKLENALCNQDKLICKFFVRTKS